jgi:hypothetical protein
LGAIGKYREHDIVNVAYPTDGCADPGQGVSRPVTWTGASEGVGMTENEINEDVEGHKHLKHGAADGDDTEGHIHLKHGATEDDDVEGHKRPGGAATEDDDVEGHKRRG